MVEQIQVLIENYDRNTKKYLLAHQEICHVSVEDLKQTLEEILRLSDIQDHFPPCVITSEYIIFKRGLGLRYQPNRRTTIFGLLLEEEDLSLNINKLQDIYSGKEKILLSVNVVDYLIFPIIFFVLFCIYYPIKSFFEVYPYQYYIILIWGALLAIFSFPYFIYTFFKKHQKIPVRYSYPFKEYFQPFNISYLITIFTLATITFILGQFDVFTLQEVITEDMLWGLIFYFVLGFTAFLLFIRRYYITKRTKEENLQELYQLIQSLPVERKIYLSQFIVKVEDSKVITTGILSKFIVFFSLIFSILPLLLAL